MGQEEDVGDPTFPALKLPLLHIPSSATSITHSPDHPSTPPLQTPVSVPFRWEEEPGKPRSCCTSKRFIPLPEPFKLELPPGNKMTRTPSPTTVLDGPCNVGRPKFSSFRWFREAQDSYDTSVSSYAYNPDGSFGVEEVLFGSKRRSGGQKKRGFFGRIKNGKKVVDGGSCRFSPSSIPDGTCDGDKNVRRSSGGGSMRRNGSFSSVTNAKPSHLLATIYQGLKQVINWKSGRKSGKEEQD